MTVKTGILMLMVCMFALTFVSCSEGEQGPARGTPEWYWLSAVERYEAGDFEKAQEHLAEVVSAESPHRDSAVIWQFVLLNGLASGYMELAEAYGSGAEENEADAAQLNNLVQQYRRDARSHTISLVDGVQQLKKQLEQAQAIALDFPLPAGTPNESPILATVSGGVLPNETQTIDVQTHTVERGVLLSAAAMAGFGDDVAKARTVFQTKPVEVPVTVFSLGVAEALLERSILFDRKHLMEVPKQAVMVNLAREFIAPALETEDEELKVRVEEVQEKLEEIEEAAKKGPA